jgi:micrococcal nuclease
MFEGTDINKKMISDGFAFAYLKYHFEKANDYKQAQITASLGNIGMWGNENIDKGIKQQEKKESISNPFLTKEYVIISIIGLLIIVGIYYYFKT